MYISNITQPGGHTLTRKISSNHRLSPCAKAIGALLLILNSTAAWANVDAVKKTHIQGIENTEDHRLQQRIREMQSHSLHLRIDLREVMTKLDQYKNLYTDIKPLSIQEVSNLEDKKKYLERQIVQHDAHERQLQQLIESRNPRLLTEDDTYKPQPLSPSTKPTPSESKLPYREITDIVMNVIEVVEIAADIPEFIKYTTEERADIQTRRNRTIATATRSEIVPLLFTNLLMAQPAVKERVDAEIIRMAQIKALQQNIDKLNNKQFPDKEEQRKKSTKDENVTTSNKVVEDTMSAEVNDVFTEIDQLGQAVFSNILFTAKPEVSAIETVKNKSENKLGSTSTNVNADISPTHEGVVNKYKIRVTQKAENAVLNDSGSLTLIGNAQAVNTLVDTDNQWSFFALENESHADTTTIRKGTMSVTGNATASKTFVGLTEEENKQQPVSSETTIKMDISTTKKVTNTTVGMHGKVDLNRNAIMEKTHIKKGGELVVKGEDNPTLSDTTVEGTLELQMSDVILNGKTVFLPGSVLKGNNYSITNNGDIIFEGTGGEIAVYSYMDGDGSLTIDSPEETLTLQGAEYIYIGLTNIQAGTLQISETNFSSSPIIGQAGAELVLSNSLLETSVNGGRMALNEKSIWNITRDSRVDGLYTSKNSQLNLSSKLFGHHRIGNKLTINGDYHSSGGELTFYSKLAGDNSETDSMLVEGNTSGHTNVRVIDLMGEGAQTDLGILLIEVKGQSNGDFKQVGRITAGAYEYKLGRGEAARNKNWYLTSNTDKFAPKEKDKAEVIPEKDDKIVKPYSSPHEVIKASSKSHYPANRIDAFLTTLEMAFKPVESEDTSVVKPTETPANALPTAIVATPTNAKPESTPVPNPTETPAKALPTAIVATPTNAEPESTPVPNPTETPAKALPTAIVATPANVKNSTKIPQKTYKPVYRPENGSYIANISMARNLFTSGLENRSGNYHYKDAITGEWRVSSMWMHTQGGRKQFGNTIDQLNIKGKYHSIQLGGDLVQWDIGTQGSGRIGVLAGLGKATNYSQSKVTGYYSNGSVNGYNLGVYATWLTDQQESIGFYIDTLAQYSWFNNKVNGQEQIEEKYKSSGFTSSVESGYAFNIGSTEQLSYFIQPSAQITWVGINAKTHTTANKDVITYDNKGQLITRIGAKTYLKTINNPNKQFMPFIAVNWLHQNKNTGTQLSGKSVEDNNKSSAEFKIGIESKIDQNLHAWANVNHQIGHDNTNDTNALVGIKYSF
ncbi:autotransporter outer membrane beta-barrel domain-containing protein [Yersinia aldovae]|uniref:autotransporter outer membrane beta-barrel domain-containing protein n=1 Tax=Yersinia aldovae TaxID=29483 RepID=UPI0005AD3107|nr:autotransporter outer membrane beta-barrel domain-containing protein [Yersinia aldovae]AJJ61352.1 outer membrane autotransporter barrel domain protein [Yersinia aldovae 670-83]